MGNNFLGLSLFIMLLSFFIVMNSVSTYEDTKISPVMDSIEMAFGGKLNAEKRARPNIRPYSAPDNLEGETLDDLESLFEAHIEDYQLKKNRLGNMMSIEMSTQEFDAILRGIELARGADRQVQRSMPFVPSLISLIDASLGAQPYRMDIFIQSEDNPAQLQNNAPKIMTPLLSRAGRYADTLEGAGLPRKLLGTGIIKGTPGRMTLSFRRYEAVRIAVKPRPSSTDAQQPAPSNAGDANNEGAEL